jgi:hypothetical protein
MSEAEERADVPVLTQVVDEAPAAPAFDVAMMEALARQLERAVLERLGPEIERVTRLALNGVRTELSTSVTLMVREAVAASVAQALAAPKRD